MSRKALVCLVLLIPLLAGATILARAAAFHSGMVPNEDVFGCNTCHYGGDFSDPPGTPQFRADFVANGRLWDAALAGLDSDGDGFTNGQELGDPAGIWEPGDLDPTVTRRWGDKETHDLQALAHAEGLLVPLSPSLLVSGSRSRCLQPQ